MVPKVLTTLISILFLRLVRHNVANGYENETQRRALFGKRFPLKSADVDLTSPRARTPPTTRKTRHSTAELLYSSHAKLELDGSVSISVILHLYLVAYLSAYREKAIKALYGVRVGAAGLHASCLPHQDGGIPLNAFPNDTTSKLAGLFLVLCL